MDHTAQRLHIHLTDYCDESWRRFEVRLTVTSGFWSRRRAAQLLPQLGERHCDVFFRVFSVLNLGILHDFSKKTLDNSGAPQVFELAEYIGQSSFGSFVDWEQVVAEDGVPVAESRFGCAFLQKLNIFIGTCKKIRVSSIKKKKTKKNFFLQNSKKFGTIFFFDFKNFR